MMIWDDDQQQWIKATKEESEYFKNLMTEVVISNEYFVS
jgi:hypothetical protein